MVLSPEGTCSNCGAPAKDAHARICPWCERTYAPPVAAVESPPAAPQTPPPVVLDETAKRGLQSAGIVFLGMTISGFTLFLIVWLVIAAVAVLFFGLLFSSVCGQVTIG